VAVTGMKLYVCYGTWTAGAPLHRHPCGEAHKALTRAGYSPEVVFCYGLGLLPDALNFTPGRRKVKELTGNCWVPVLVLDDGTVIQGSRKIIDWARDNGAGAPTAASDAGAASEADAARAGAEAGAEEFSAEAGPGPISAGTAGPDPAGAGTG
jgi:hypothetical protein